MPQKINIKTSDNVNVVGNFYPPAAPDVSMLPGVILLHMMPATKESWRGLAQKLNSAGFQCLAIDLRGHGESEAGPEGYKKFTDIQHQKSRKDAESAVDFFLSKGLPLEKIVLIGASIGANLSFEFQTQHPEVKATVLLSPGLNYKGIETESLAKKIKIDQSVFLSAGGENDEYSSETVQKLFEILKSKNKEIKIFENAGHGTTILQAEPKLIEDIINWLKNIYQND